MPMWTLILAVTVTSVAHGLPAQNNLHDQRVGERAIISAPAKPVLTSYRPITTLQSVPLTIRPSLTGSVLTKLPSLGYTQAPLKTSVIPKPTHTIVPISSSLAFGPTKALPAVSNNVFVPIASDAPPPQVVARDDHPVKKLEIVDKDVPIETNKFYANFFLGKQTSPVWTHPYSLAWAKGAGNSYGMAVSHVERDQLAWAKGTPPQYFIGPVGIQHIVLSAQELQKNTILSTEQLTAFSVYANLAPSAESVPVITFPCVQGMGFVTAIYNNGKPQLTSSVLFRTVTYVKRPNSNTYKYKIQLEDNSQWLLYATPIASLGAPPFTLRNSALIEGPAGFIGMIQIAKNPAGSSGEQVYDSTAGAFAHGATLSGSTSGAQGSYTIAWNKGGIQEQTLLMFALPHHIESLDQPMKAAGVLTDIELVTITKGMARALVSDTMTLIEQDLPDSIGFAPWIRNADGTAGGYDNTALNDAAVALIRSSGTTELSQNFIKQTSLNSMYYSGKGLAKFASIIYAVQSLGKDNQLAAAGLVKLKDAFNVFVNNTQPLPLVYDNVWKGVVSSGTYQKGDTGLDFGNTLYNDHHFHYGYFVYTAAMIAHFDPSWLSQGTNQAWVNMLVRDFANPSTSDPYFPFARSFDWFMGHSWAKGLFESGDGKDQESTSEDTFATYALKMWGKTIRDANMEARANLQLAVQARSLRNYFLLQSDNKVQPAQFLPNKVTGILFENKVDHTTYFGTNPEYIQGIHMIPINPSSAYTRSRQFVTEEWNTYFSQGRADQVVGGWRGVLYSNLCLIDPVTAYGFFAQDNFDMGLLDGGASRTWYLAYAAAMGGATSATSKKGGYQDTTNPYGKGKTPSPAVAAGTASSKATSVPAPSPAPQHAQQQRPPATAPQVELNRLESSSHVTPSNQDADADADAEWEWHWYDTDEENDAAFQPKIKSGSVKGSWRRRRRVQRQRGRGHK